MQPLKQVTQSFSADQGVTFQATYWNTTMTVPQQGLGLRLYSVTDPTAVTGAATLRDAVTAGTGLDDVLDGSQGTVPSLYLYWGGGVPAGVTTVRRTLLHFSGTVTGVGATDVNVTLVFGGYGKIQVHKNTTLLTKSSYLVHEPAPFPTYRTQAEIEASTGYQIHETTIKDGDTLDVYYFQNGEPWGGIFGKVIAQTGIAGTWTSLRPALRDAPVIGSSLLSLGAVTGVSLPYLTGARVRRQERTIATVELDVATAPSTEPKGYEVHTSSGETRLIDNANASLVLKPGRRIYFEAGYQSQDEATTNHVDNPSFALTDTLYRPGWDTSLNGTLRAAPWGSYNGGVTSPEVGYHAHPVSNEGRGGGPCMKLINQNNQFGHRARWLGTSNQLASNVGTELSWADGVEVTVSAWAKVDHVDQQVEIGLYHYHPTNLRFEFGTYITRYTLPVANEWVRLSTTYTLSSTDWDFTRAATIYVYGQYSLNLHEGISWIDDVQVETKDHATLFVDGAREETEVYPRFTGVIDQIVPSQDGLTATIQCSGFERKLETAFDENYPDPLAYLSYGFVDREWLGYPVFGVPAFDAWPLEIAVAEACYRAGVDAYNLGKSVNTANLGKKQYRRATTGALFYGAKRFQARSPVDTTSLVTLPRNRNYGNLGLLYNERLPSDDPYLHPAEVSERLLDRALELADKYGYDFFFDAEGQAVLGARNNPTQFVSFVTLVEV